jgi:hypothetical protein
MHYGEFVPFIAFGDVILQGKITHHIRPSARTGAPSPQGEGFGAVQN